MAPVLTKSGAPSNRREKIPEGTLCVVCCDFASGIHYSVASCNGCKTFFRRALVNKHTFTCQFTGECLVGKNVRCVCRSCRLKKCFEAGMDPKAIQHDRDKIRYTKVLKRQKEEAKAQAEAEREKLMKVKEEMGSPGGLECCDQPSSSSMSFGIDFEVLFGGGVKAELDSTLRELMIIERKLIDARNSYRQDDQMSTLWNMYIGSKALLNEDDWLISVTQLQPFVFEITDRSQVPAQESSFKYTRLDRWGLREWFQRDLTLMMEWVKLLPGGSNMRVEDKVILQKAFAVNYVVLQLAFYTKDMTSLAAADNTSSADQISFDEKIRAVKRPREEPIPSPPPPIPSFDASSISSGFMNIASSLYNQPVSKKTREENEDNGNNYSDYLRKLTEQAASFSGASTPSSSFTPSTSNLSQLDLSTLPSFLRKNNVTGVGAFADGLNKYQSILPQMPPTMHSGLPGALSSVLAMSLHTTLTSDTSFPSIDPSFSTPMPVYPSGFFSALAAASPGSLSFPQSPLLGASPLIASSPLIVPSPLLMPPSLLSSLQPAPLTPTDSLLSQLQMMVTRSRTPEETIDVETLSTDGKIDDKGSHAMEDILGRREDGQFRVPASPSKKLSETRRDSQEGSRWARPSIPVQRILSNSPPPTEIMKRTEVKEEPMSPYCQMIKSVDGENGQMTVIKSTSDQETKEEEKMTMMEESEEVEDEDTPCDPTPEALIMNRVNYPDGKYIDREGNTDHERYLHGRLIDGVWKPLRRLDIDQETFVLYKMMVFFNTEIAEHGKHKMSEEGVKYVNSMRQKMYLMLMLHLQRKRGKDGVAIFSNLVLLVANVQRCRASLNHVFDLNTIFEPSNDLIDQLILRDEHERVPSPSAFKPYEPK